MPHGDEDPDLLDVRRPGLTPATPPLSWMVGEAALVLAYRVLQARSKGPYAIPSPEVAPTRIYYESDDGWRAPLFHLPARPGTSGEPVVLVHGLGGTHRDFALEPARSLATALSGAGYSVYLVEHRGDRSAIPPEGARSFSADDLALRDVDAAIRMAAAHAGYPRALAIGHGLGAQLLYLRAAHMGHDPVVAMATLCAAVRFDAGVSTLRAAGVVATLLPAGWTLPTRRLSQLASPLVAEGADVGSPGTAGPVARARMRHATGDLHGGVLRQMARWATTGHLTDATGRLDVTAALPPLPALVIEPDADPACPRGAAHPVVEPLGAEFLPLTGGWGHLDPLLGTRAPDVVHAELLTFLEAWRRRCW